jgi:DNA-directed RNA polymerase specialized sigma subunit
MSAWSNGNVPVEDLIAMGNEALFLSALRWKPKNNSKFATYAKPFIERGVKRELDNTSNLIRLPVNILQNIKRMTYVERKLSQLLGRKPKNIELAKCSTFREPLPHCSTERERSESERGSGTSIVAIFLARRAKIRSVLNAGGE